MNRPNPKRVPTTKRDVEKAEDRGRIFGIEFCLSVILFVLMDKHDAKTEELEQFRDEFMYYMDSLAKGYLSYADIKNTLSEEYGLTIEIK